MGKGWKVLIILGLLILTLSTYITALLNEEFLAATVNDTAINDPYINQYLESFNHFSDLEYQTVQNEASVVLSVGNKEDNIKGYEIAGKKYVIHLLFCDYNLQKCTFRVNGIPKSLHSYKVDQPETESAIFSDENYKIEVNSIIFDYCGGRRFCNLHYEAYDLVNISVKPR